MVAIGSKKADLKFFILPELIRTLMSFNMYMQKYLSVLFAVAQETGEKKRMRTRVYVIIAQLPTTN